jgi:hypothetical protein
MQWLESQTYDPEEASYTLNHSSRPRTTKPFIPPGHMRMVTDGSRFLGLQEVHLVAECANIGSSQSCAPAACN